MGAFLAAFCVCLSGCSGLETLFMSKQQVHEEILRDRENPNRLIEKNEETTRSETFENIQRQYRKDEAAREKIINDLLEKQFQNQRSLNP